MKKHIIKKIDETFIYIFPRLLKTLKSIKVTNLGIFKLVKIKARKSHDPQGRKITIPAHTRIVFRPTKKLKNFINN